VNLWGNGAWLNQHNSSVGYYNLTDVDTGKILCESVLVKDGKMVAENRCYGKSLRTGPFYCCALQASPAYGLYARSATVWSFDQTAKKQFAHAPRLGLLWLLNVTWW